MQTSKAGGRSNEANREGEMKRRKEAEKGGSGGKTYTVSEFGNISFKWPVHRSSRITSNFGDGESPTRRSIPATIRGNSDMQCIQHKGGYHCFALWRVVISTCSYSAEQYIMIDHGRRE